MALFSAIFFSAGNSLSPWADQFWVKHAEWIPFYELCPEKKFRNVQNSSVPFRHFPDRESTSSIDIFLRDGSYRQF